MPYHDESPGTLSEAEDMSMKLEYEDEEEIEKVIEKNFRSIDCRSYSNLDSDEDTHEDTEEATDEDIDADSDEDGEDDAQSDQSSESEIPKQEQKKGRPTFAHPELMVDLIAKMEDDNITLTVHKEVVCHYSPVLATFFANNPTKSYTFNSTKRALKLLVQWLYSQNLFVDRLHEDRVWLWCPGDEDLALIELWVMAEGLEIPNLQNLVIKVIDDIYQVCHYFPGGCIGSAYEATSRGSKLREYLVALYVKSSWLDCIIEEDEELPQEFLIELAQYLSNKLHDDQKAYDISEFMN
ncbi:hypothetical protein EG329_011495 [Mollisiaceae sp. DMI_Dod_QoI]|nr:hypothetical protein EG329_011495 [Helotiales sp. DMI_Dod_QoI]